LAVAIAIGELVEVRRTEDDDVAGVLPGGVELLLEASAWVTATEVDDDVDALLLEQWQQVRERAGAQVRVYVDLAQRLAGAGDEEEQGEETHGQGNLSE